MKNIIKKLRNYPNIFYPIYRIYLPIKVFRRRKNYLKHYKIASENIKKSTGKKVYFIGVPIHNNLGDQAQYYCIIKWLKENYPNYQIIELTDNIIYTNFKNIIKLIKQNIKDDDIFVFQSGYRTTDVSNFEGEYAHQRILKNFKNKVLVFPQTINFKSKREKEKSIKAYKKNDNYLFLARDEISYNYATCMYDKNKVFLYPDIVTTLIGNNIFRKDRNNKKGILLCLRNDSEKLYSKEQYNQLIEKIRKIDECIKITDTNSCKSFEFDRSIVENEIKKKIEEFSQYKLIITDRYHGTIFSLISNTNVIVLNSTDHKLSSGVNWFKGIYDNHITYFNSLENLEKIVEERYYNKNPHIQDEYFKKNYYDKLKQYMGK